MRLHGLKLIEEYRKHPEAYYPMADQTGQMPDRNEYGEVNIGWYAGMLEENRPFFADCWAVDGMTILTMLVSTKGIEDKSAEELDRWFQDTGYYRQRKPGQNLPQVRKYTNKDNNEFFSINLTVGIEDEPALIDGGIIYSWNSLNEYNRKTIV